METLSWLCLFLPLAGVTVLTLAGTRITRQIAAWLGTGFAFASFICAAVVFFSILGEGESTRSHVYTLYTWAGSAHFHVPLGILVDQLAVVEMLIVSGVGALIVMYSVGYMDGDPKERRFFAYLDLFLFSMLLLVMADNFVLLLAGWGLVGLSSYLLIGFWHERKEPVDAAKKAFVMNAIGDVGIAIAIFFMVRDIGTTDYAQVFAQAHTVWPKGGTDANWVALMLLVGAVAKSAQIPLHTWLPDAMEGPTPVSALIHAATMVTAGVYLIARTHVLFENAPNVQALVALIGVATLLMAGVIALVQTDIKKIIAYHEPDRLHVRGRGGWCVLGGHVPPAHPCVLQGAPVPRRRHRHPRPGERTGRAPDGRAGEGDAPHHDADVGRDDRTDRVLAAVEGSDPGRRAPQGQHCRLDRLPRRPVWRPVHRHLRDPPDAARLLWRDERFREGSPARGSR
jgi:proton-conducting membrane transporter/NADH-ubiquinone oxidoreductase (complex I) subunit 5